MEINKPTIDVLIEGFVDETLLRDHGQARYLPTITLIRAENTVIIVDPGSVGHQVDIVNALDKCDLGVSDVTHVITTHHHLDHVRNVGMFPDIPIIDHWATWTGIEYDTASPALLDGISIVKTPGHTYDSLTVFVETDEGVVAICGDLFWFENDNSSDVYAESSDQLLQSRALVLQKADFVIPGHGPKFNSKS